MFELFIGVQYVSYKSSIYSFLDAMNALGKKSIDGPPGINEPNISESSIFKPANVKVATGIKLESSFTTKQSFFPEQFPEMLRVPTL